MEKPHPEPITSDFSTGSMLNSGDSPPARVSIIIAAAILAALGGFFAIVHYWR